MSQEEKFALRTKTAEDLKNVLLVSTDEPGKPRTPHDDLRGHHEVSTWFVQSLRTFARLNEAFPLERVLQMVL
eukprot:COSAG04_NODE_16446_length_498_cov_14.333333_2_plen_72_part_01